MKRKWLAWGLSVICALLVVWNGYLLNEMANQSEKQYEANAFIEDLQERLDAVNQKQDQLEQDKEELLEQLTVTQKQLGSSLRLKGHMVDQLKTMGIDDPQVILEDLLEQSELIPYEGVLGGTMFVSEAWLLTDHYALAAFEDGHVMGTMLLEYTIDSGKISWKVLASRMD